MTHDVSVNTTDGTKTANILIIDDDRELAEMLRDFLAPDHLCLSACLNGEDGLMQLREDDYELLILDIMLPAMSGLDVLKQLRQHSSIPVIMLTARGDDIDRIIGLEFGADDYLAKPFNPRELTARIKAILRRTGQAPQSAGTRQLGTIMLDPRTRRATVGGNPVRLTGTEFEILHCLLETPGEVVSKEHLNKRALGRQLQPFDRSIDTHISNLRAKLEQAGSAGESIQNQRGVGYLLLPGQ